MTGPFGKFLYNEVCGIFGGYKTGDPHLWKLQVCGISRVEAFNVTQEDTRNVLGTTAADPQRNHGQEPRKL